jgi:hypothetical protein
MLGYGCPPYQRRPRLRPCAKICGWQRLGAESMRGDRGLGPYLNLLSEIGDRTEGRPIQVTQSYSKRTTIFERPVSR